MECELGGGKQTGTLKLEAVDSSTVKGSMQMVASNGGRSMTVGGLVGMGSIIDSGVVPCARQRTRVHVPRPRTCVELRASSRARTVVDSFERALVPEK